MKNLITLFVLLKDVDVLSKDVHIPLRVVVETVKYRLFLFCLSITLFSSLIPLCLADSTLRRSSNFAYLMMDYGTKVKFNSDLYCTQIGWIDNDGNGEYDQVKFYNAYIGSGTAQTFWVSMQNANITITKLLFGTAITATIIGDSGDTSTTTIGGLPSSPEHVRVDGAYHNEWGYSEADTTVTVTITHSSSHALIVSWAPPEEPAGATTIVYPTVKGRFMGAKTFYPSLADLLQRETTVSVSFELDSTYYDGDITLFYTARCLSSDQIVAEGNQTVNIEPDMIKTVTLTFDVLCGWNTEREEYKVSVYTVVSGMESDTISQVVAVENGGDAVLQYKGLVLSSMLFLVGLTYYVWTSKKEKKVLGVKT